MKLSEFELDVMQHFWNEGPLSSTEIIKRITANKGVADNTVRTIIVRLEEKGALEQVGRAGKAFVYKPLFTRESMTSQLLPKFIKRLFGDNPRSLIAHVIQDGKLSKQDVADLKKLLEDYEDTPK